MFDLSKKNLFISIFLISLIALISAYFIEYILGHQPCSLCLYERIPFFLAGFTPLPYKAFTIASGLIGFNLLIFIIVSLISRSLRFFIISYLSYKFGYLFTDFMNRHGSKWFTILGILLVIILVIIFLFYKFNV